MNEFAFTENVRQYRSFVIRKNIERYTKLLDTVVQEGSRRTVLALLAEEKARLKALGLNEAGRRMRGT